MSGINGRYLLLCFGESYVEDSLDLIFTLRHFEDFRPIDIVVLPPDVELAKKKGFFRNIFTFDPSSDPDYKFCNTSFEKFCLIPRLNLYRFIGEEPTMILDVDILCAHNTEKSWDILLSSGRKILMLGNSDNKKWHWGHWGNVCERLLIPSIETHGGLFFFNNPDKKELSDFFSLVRFAFRNYESLGMLSLYQGGKVDEPCFAYAFAKLGISPIGFGEHPIMTFNLSSKETIPTKKMTEEIQAREMDDFIPFVHMFCKNQSPEFHKLKNRILAS
jgi:hypothetical protein